MPGQHGLLLLINQQTEILGQYLIVMTSVLPRDWFKQNHFLWWMPLPSSDICLLISSCPGIGLDNAGIWENIVQRLGIADWESMFLGFSPRFVIDTSSCSEMEVSLYESQTTSQCGWGWWRREKEKFNQFGISQRTSIAHSWISLTY